MRIFCVLAVVWPLWGLELAASAFSLPSTTLPKSRPLANSLRVPPLHANKKSKSKNAGVTVMDQQDAPQDIQAEAQEEAKQSAPVAANEKHEEYSEKDITAQSVDFFNDEPNEMDQKFMRMAIEMAQSAGGERGPDSAFPNPTVGAVLVSVDGRVMGQGRSDYMRDAVRAVLEDTGLEPVALKEWCVPWPSSQQFRDDLSSSTLYITLEPSALRKGEVVPPVTKLIEQAGIPNVVIGCPNPVAEHAYKGATAMFRAGVSARMLQNTDPLHLECLDLIPLFSELANSKIRRMARKQFQLFGRPLGFLHCSVVDSKDLELYSKRGNAFGSLTAGSALTSREFAYEMAPPPEVVWGDDIEDDDLFDDDDDDDILSLDFEDEDFQGGIYGSPMTPWYEQADAVVATMPSPGNGPANDDSLEARLNGLRWLATQGMKLPPGVERILVMDATDLSDLPLTNDDPKNPAGVNIEDFWAGIGRRPTRVLLRRGNSAQAKAAAMAAAEAASHAAEAAEAAMDAVETGDAERAADAAVQYQKAALAKTEIIQKYLEEAQLLKNKLVDRGVIVETIEGSEPVDVMKHLGKRSGLRTVVWRAGCWGKRGSQSILAGAFQMVSAHLAVDATGGRFWQLMLAENAVQNACGPRNKVKLFADQEDISLEYCDQPEADSDCTLTLDNKPVRHIRLDCRVALVDNTRRRNFVNKKTKRIDQRYYETQAPWFL